LKRGVEISTLRQWECGFDGVRKRVVFPVRRSDKKLVGVVGRSIHSFQLPRYLNYYEFDKGRYLYGEHLIRDNTSVVVCEGLLDALCVWQSLNQSNALDKYSVVCPMGADLTKFQLDKLMRFTDTVILFLDNDPAGWSGQLSVARGLQDKLLLCAVKYPSLVGGDPASLYNDGVDILKLIESADLLLSMN
jgi:DNA primase